MFEPSNLWDVPVSFQIKSKCSYTIFIANWNCYIPKHLKQKYIFTQTQNSHANYEWKMKANIWMYFIISSLNVPLVLYFYFVQGNVNIITLLFCYQCYSLLLTYFHTVCVIRLWPNDCISCFLISLRSQLYFLVLCTKTNTHILISNTHLLFGIHPIRTTCFSVFRQ